MGERFDLEECYEISESGDKDLEQLEERLKVIEDIMRSQERLIDIRKKLFFAGIVEGLEMCLENKEDNYDYACGRVQANRQLILTTEEFILNSPNNQEAVRLSIDVGFHCVDTEVLNHITMLKIPKRKKHDLKDLYCRMNDTYQLETKVKNNIN